MAVVFTANVFIVTLPWKLLFRLPAYQFCHGDVIEPVTCFDTGAGGLSSADEGDGLTGVK
jgi:hypothetical protein